MDAFGALHNDSEYVAQTFVEILKEHNNPVKLELLGQLFSRKVGKPYKSFITTSLKKFIEQHKEKFALIDWNISNRERTALKPNFKDENEVIITVNNENNWNREVVTSPIVESYDDEMTNVYVNYIPNNFDMMKEFAIFGPIASVRQESSFGFVCFVRHDDAKTAIEAMDGAIYNNQRIKVKFAPKKYQKKYSNKNTITQNIRAKASETEQEEDLHTNAALFISQILQNVQAVEPKPDYSRYLDISLSEDQVSSIKDCLAEYWRNTKQSYM